MICKAFSHVGCLSTFLILSFEAQNFNFDEIKFVFYFNCLCFWCHMPVLSSKRLVVLPLTFRSSICWVNICIWCEVDFHFILLHVDIQLSRHYLLKRLFFLHWIVLVPLFLVENKLIINVLTFISGFSVLFYWFIFLFLCQYHTVLVTADL